ncbi:MAG: TspO/MBR family protein [Geitlerinemataceae cyanobacterium]
MLFAPFSRRLARRDRAASLFFFAIPAWTTIGVVTVGLVALSGLGLGSEEIRWFRGLRRPDWLTFERFIPLIWTTIFLCGAASATVVWNNAPDRITAWALMAFYVVVELTTLAYTSVMCQTRSLRVGTIIGGAGLILCAMLCVVVFRLSPIAAAFLAPYLLWSPVGTYTTWELGRLNPDEW